MPICRSLLKRGFSKFSASLPRSWLLGGEETKFLNIVMLKILWKRKKSILNYFYQSTIYVRNQALLPGKPDENDRRSLNIKIHFLNLLK
jgi:hypothetical protein